MTEETQNIATSEQKELDQIEIPQDDDKEIIREKKRIKKIIRRLKLIIFVLNIIGSLCVFGQSICSILKSINNIQLTKLQFIDVQALIVSSMIGLSEMFIRVVVVLYTKFKDAIMKLFSINTSKLSYLISQIMLSFMQGPQSLFPNKKDKFNNIFNTLISCFLVFGWIFNFIGYILFMFGQFYKKRLEKKIKKENTPKKKWFSKKAKISTK